MFFVFSCDSSCRINCFFFVILVLIVFLLFLFFLGSIQQLSSSYMGSSIWDLRCLWATSSVISSTSSVRGASTMRFATSSCIVTERKRGSIHMHRPTFAQLLQCHCVAFGNLQLLQILLARSVAASLMLCCVQPC